MVMKSLNALNFLSFFIQFDSFNIKMHGLPRSVLLDIFFTNLVFPFKATSRSPLGSM